MKVPFLRSHIFFLPLLTLLVIVFGAYVRLTDAGLGCPDWPGCYGSLSVPSAASQISANNPDWDLQRFDAGKAWREMVHRYLAALLGLGIFITAISRWRTSGFSSRNYPFFATVPLVLFQGLLGMFTVTLLLQPLVVTAHLVGGLTILALLWWDSLVRIGFPAGDRKTRGTIHLLAIISLLVLTLQILLGGWTSTNYAALACVDFPKCQGLWWPQTDFRSGFSLWGPLGQSYEFGVLDTPARTAIHMAHRLGAVVVFGFLVVLAFLSISSGDRLLSRTGCMVFFLLLVQVLLGVANVLAGLPLYVAVAHNAVASLLLLSIILVLFSTRNQT
jgi:cytochrome c oxidase assembly protein subunit 15